MERIAGQENDSSFVTLVSNNRYESVHLSFSLNNNETRNLYICSFSTLDLRFSKVSILANYVTLRYAYVTIHYEGTKRDDEYRLAVRVWAKSLFAHGISRDCF